MCSSEIHFWGHFTLSVLSMQSVKASKGNRPPQGGSLWEEEGEQQMPKTRYQTKGTQTKSDTQWPDHLHTTQDDSQDSTPWLWLCGQVVCGLFLSLLCFGEVCHLDRVLGGCNETIPLSQHLLAHFPLPYAMCRLW